MIVLTILQKTWLNYFEKALQMIHLLRGRGFSLHTANNKLKVFFKYYKFRINCLLLFNTSFLTGEHNFLEKEIKTMTSR